MTSISRKTAGWQVAGRLALTMLLATGLALSGLVPGAGVTEARAFTGGSFAACSQPHLLNYIQSRFVWTDRHVLRRGLRIDAIDRARETHREPTTPKHQIGRIHCQATALMNDGRQRQIWYMIETGMGFASINDNVEFCIAGLDPWKVYGAWCRSVR